MSRLTKDRIYKTLFLIVYLVLFLISLRLIFPFYLALLTIAALSLPAGRLKAYTKLSMTHLRLILLFITVLLLFWAGNAIIHAVIGQSEGFFTSLYDTITTILQSLYTFIEKLKTRFQIGDLFTEDKFASLFSTLFQNALSAASSRLAALAAALIKALPRVLLATVLYLFATFYIALDYENLKTTLTSLIPKSIRPLLGRIKRSLLQLLRHTLKAYGILFLITFVILSVAFLFLRLDYPIWWALFTASLDALPAIGIGIVLLPWGIALLCTGNKFTGIALLILYLALTILRQALEPKILGRELGVPPLISLLSLYLGFQLIGGWGLLLSPILSVLLTRFLFRRKTSDAKQGVDL